jgi:hypothetical protein
VKELKTLAETLLREGKMEIAFVEPHMEVLQGLLK